MFLFWIWEISVLTKDFSQGEVIMKTTCLILLLSLYCAAGVLPAESKEKEQEIFNLTVLEYSNAKILNSAMMAGDWLINNQEKRTLGEGFFNGDYGRWLYEYFPYNDFWRGSVGWTTATGIMDLICLYERTGYGKYKDGIERAAHYLKSLQVLDPRDKRIFGAVREMHQLDNHIYPRDGITTGMGYLALYRFTGEKDYLERSELFADWFLKYAMNKKNRFPLSDFPFDANKCTAADSVMGNYHGGTPLFFYHMYKITGNKRYLNEGVIPIVDVFIEKFLLPNGAYQLTLVPDGSEAIEYKVPINHVSNDDFATIAILAAFRETGDRKYWDAAMEHINWLMSVQRPDGGLPGFPAGVYSSSMSVLEAIALAEEKGLEINRKELDNFVRGCADFGLTMQETDPTKNIKSYGGFYCQSWHSLRRDWIHARNTTYSILFNLRYEGRIKVPFYSLYGWDKVQYEF